MTPRTNRLSEVDRDNGFADRGGGASPLDSIRPPHIVRLDLLGVHFSVSPHTHLFRGWIQGVTLYMCGRKA